MTKTLTLKGWNSQPLLIIQTSCSESPTTFLSMFNEPFTSALINFQIED